MRAQAQGGGWPWRLPVRKDEDLFGVLVLSFYFYTKVYWDDHDELAKALGAIISEWNAIRTWR